MAKETIGGSIFRSQVTVVHTNLVVGFVFVLASADNLQLVNFSGTNVDYQGFKD
jgi:hypothetical protein